MSILKKLSLAFSLVFILMSQSSYGMEMDIVNAVRTESLARIRELIATGADVNKQDDKGFTPLHWAVMYDHENIVETLFAAKADVNKQDGDGLTPLHWAAANGPAKLVETLIAAGAGVNRQDSDGLIPLHYAVMGYHADIVEMLIDYGADVDKQDKHGWASLHYAAEIGSPNNADIAQMLIGAGADINLKDQEGLTALGHALKYNDAGIIALINEYKSRMENFAVALEGADEEGSGEDSLLSWLPKELWLEIAENLQKLQ